MGCPALHIDSRFSAYTPKLEVVPKRTTPKKVFKYYPYGMLMPGRFGEASNADYRYGFQGQEKDDEIKGEGNSVNYKYRMHDPRLGRFFAVDPLTSKYPHYTPYSFSGNKVIHAVELEGLEEFPVIEDKCFKFDEENKKGIHLSFPSFKPKLTKQVVEIVRPPAPPINVNANGRNRGVTRRVRLRVGGTVTFNAFNIQDGIQITGSAGGVIGNNNQQGLQVYNVPAGRNVIRVTPNTNPANQGGNTLWTLQINRSQQKVKKKTKYKIMGITVMTKVEKQWVDPNNANNNGPTTTKRRVLGIRVSRNSGNRDITLSLPGSGLGAPGRRRGPKKEQNFFPKPKGI